MKATQASRPVARAAPLCDIARKLDAISRRLGQASGRVSAPCAENLERLVADAQTLALELAS